MWVHTSKGIFACIRTEVPEDPYRPVIRNSNFQSVNHLGIVNIYNEQWFINEDFKIISLDSAGNLSYESFLIEPTLQLANLTKLPLIQACQYKSNSKNQYRVIYTNGGDTSPSVMLAANYLSRTPPDEYGKSYPVWEYHTISSTAIGVVYDESVGYAKLYTGDSDGYIYRQDYGTNDNGSAISWSHSLGWFKTLDRADYSSSLRAMIQYFKPVGDWTINARTDFDFGDSGGQVYPVRFPPSGDRFDIDLIFDTSVFTSGNSLKRVVTNLSGVYTYLKISWYGDTVDEYMELHTIAFIPIPIEGFRAKN